MEAPGAREKAARSSARLLRTPAKLQDADDAPPTTHPSVKERAARFMARVPRNGACVPFCQWLWWPELSL